MTIKSMCRAWEKLRTSSLSYRKLFSAYGYFNAGAGLRRIVDGGLCHGCGGCAGLLGAEKVEMRLSPEGFLRPQSITDLSPSDENMIKSVCSGATIKQNSIKAATHPLWGPLVNVEVGYATNNEIRFVSSSGGVISSLCLHMLETKKVDFILHTKASPKDPVGNTTACSRSREEVLSGAGSRYAPSAPLAEIAIHLESGKRFIFVGKPCDVATLRRIAEIDARVDAQIPYMFSFFCAGVPSRFGALAVLEALEVEEASLNSFRYRGMGWPGLTRAVRNDGSEVCMDYAASWGKILSRHLQFRCKICPDGTGEFADIACGDAWYGKDGFPTFDEQDGRSLIVARSEKGHRLLGELVRAGHLVTVPIEPEEIRMMQPYQEDRRRAILARIAAMWLRGRSLPRYTGLGLVQLALRTSPISLLRNFIGTLRRIPFGRPLA